MLKVNATGKYESPYEEEKELAEYAWRLRDRFMTPFERRCFFAGLIREKWAGLDSEQARTYLGQHGALDDIEVNRALLRGFDAFVERTKTRIAREIRRSPYLARCPECARIVATPEARQCLWCGHDWH